MWGAETSVHTVRLCVQADISEAKRVGARCAAEMGMPFLVQVRETRMVNNTQ